jgi:hypothetical protein
MDDSADETSWRRAGSALFLPLILSAVSQLFVAATIAMLAMFS